MTRWRARAAAIVFAAASMAHVGSPDTFFSGKAGPYDVRVSVRLPGVIPGRAQIAVRVVGATRPQDQRVTVRAGQWNVGLEGAPPPERAAPVPGDPELYAAELWFMTPSSYQMAVAVEGPSGGGSVVVPVLALATAQRAMPPWLGAVLAALGVFLTAGLLTIIGSAVRESVLPPGVEPDRVRVRRARAGVAIMALLAGLALWGGNAWWTAEASSYSRSVLYRPFTSEADVARDRDRRILTLGIRDVRWSGLPAPQSPYNALLPDHGKLMHLFMVREPGLDALAHLHPVPRTPEAMDFVTDVPPLPPGRYRVYGDIVHESGYAQTLVSSVELAGAEDAGGAALDADDSWFAGGATAEAAAATFDLGDGTHLEWQRGDQPLVAGVERDLRFVVRDAAGAVATVEPYMGMAAHLVVANRDGSVFAHLHPAGSVSMAAMQKFAGGAAADPHAGHDMPIEGAVAVPYAFPKAGPFRIFVQIKRGGGVKTAAFDVDVRQIAASASPSGTRASAAAVHPLDPLSADEIRAAVQIARTDARFAGASFPSVAVQDPPKAEVLAWQAGRPLVRQARVQAMTGGGFYELLIDLTARRLVSAIERRGVEPSITLSEIEGTRIVLSNAEFKAGLQKRGITDLTKVFCAPFSAGYFGSAAQDGKRLVKVGCFDTRRSTTNIFGWPIERLYALVDLRRMEVLSVADYGVVPIAEGDFNYDASAGRTRREPRKPTTLAQPLGTNARIDGHEISWGNWRFHVRIDPRVGTAISLARWRDGQAWRSVLYQGYLSEMFVPYMDAAYGWQSRTYFDTGEYGAGVLASTLKAGVDCPETASFLPADFASDKGEPFTTPNAVCVFERSGGDPIWRHFEAVNQTYEGRANVELVVRMAAAIGNYDYLFDWIFNDAAEIEVRVGATGIDALKGVGARTMRDPGAADDTRFGTLVAPNLVAVNHDHYFNFRLDLDIDGPTNSVNRDVYRPVQLPSDSARRSLYVVERHIAETETAAALDTHGDPVRLRVINEHRANGVGNPASYEVLAFSHARLMLDADDWPARRAGFLRHDLWVTPYQPDERYAGGQYMLGSHGDDGLAVWAARDRAIRNQDVVVWINLGMHHLTRAEDLPVTPTMWQSFRLRPNNFFDRNPSIDLPTGTVTR